MTIPKAISMWQRAQQQQTE